MLGRRSGHPGECLCAWEVPGAAGAAGHCLCYGQSCTQPSFSFSCASPWSVTCQMSPVLCAGKVATSKLGYIFWRGWSFDGEILLNCSVYILLESKLFSISISTVSDLTKLRKTFIPPVETQHPLILMHTSSWRAFLSCWVLSIGVCWYRNDPQRCAGWGTVEFPGLTCDIFHCASGAGVKSNVLQQP